MKIQKTLVSIGVLCILYAVGLIGTIWFDASILKLSSINLLVSIFILGINHQPLDSKIALFAGIVFFASFTLEAVGVSTGAIFGQYFYGENLGVKVFETPLIIGINWLMLCYCSSVVVSQIIANHQAFNKPLIKALIAAVIMVGLDAVIEQVAPMVDFWFWKNQVVPLQNYTAWFAFAFAFNFLFQQLQIESNNRVAAWLLGLQVVFFVSLYVYFY